MKKTVFLFLLLSQVLFAQDNDKTIYLDSLGSQTSVGAHSSYRIITDYKLEKETYRVADYYLSGKLKREGSSTKKDFVHEKGEFVSYYENGNRKSVVNFEDGIRNGDCTFWHENGNKKLEGQYQISGDEKSKKAIFKVINYWDSNNIKTVTDGNGEFEDDGSYEEDGAYCISNGLVKNGFKDGSWNGYQYKGNFTFAEVYENTKFVSGVSTDTKGTKYPYTEIFEKAAPKKGLSDLYKYVGKKFNQPKNFRGSGKVITQFVVDKEGKIIELKTVKSIDREVDAEAIRAIASYEGFRPARHRGIKVRCSYMLPIAIMESE